LAEAPLPRLGALGASFSDDIILAPAVGDRDPATVRTPTAFGDDIPTGRALVVRVRVTDHAERGYTFDYRDSDAAVVGSPQIALGPEAVADATARALCHALGLEAVTDAVRDACRIELAPNSWVGSEPHDTSAPCVAFARARVFDAALGALGNAWPSRVGAGSCSLGAIVQLRAPGHDAVNETLPGGEGATPSRAGRDAWPGPLGATLVATTAAWVQATQSVREGSGGLGARHGGRGIERQYTVTRDAEAYVALDRISNPPHGIARAGPPQPAELWLALPGEALQRVPAWVTHAMPSGSTLVVKTAGGAGHGFPGWGVDWDPDDF